VSRCRDKSLNGGHLVMLVQMAVRHTTQLLQDKPAALVILEMLFTVPPSKFKLTPMAPSVSLLLTRSLSLSQSRFAAATNLAVSEPSTRAVRSEQQFRKGYQLDPRRNRSSCRMLQWTLSCKKCICCNGLSANGPAGSISNILILFCWPLSRSETVTRH